MIVSWMTTNQCNLRCSHCYQDAGEKLDAELSTLEAKALISQIAKAGFRIMIFSGGEPLMRPDILELTAFAASLGLRPVFGTNGTLISPQTAKDLKQAGAATMGISVDSLQAAGHDRFRGMPGALGQTLKGIQSCREAGLPFQIHTTVMDWNKPELTTIIDFAQASGAVAHYIFFLIPVGRGVFLEETSLESLAYEQTLRTIMEKQRAVSIEIKPTCAPQFTRVASQLAVPTRFHRGCLAGLSYCIVSPTGKVRPCAYMVEEAGDIRLSSFDDIWNGSPLFAQLRTKAYKGACASCSYREICGGCRARAGYYHQGDILSEDSYCAYGQGLLLEGNEQ